jgi:hypothetical protein
VYHVELRQFPHNFCHFNMSEGELQEAVLDGWVRGRWIELGERKWNPEQAKLTVLEGPHLPIEELSLGRGWRNARRHGQDVTERLLAERAAAVGESAQGAGTMDGPAAGRAVQQARAQALAADSLALEVLARLTDRPTPIAQAWRQARERYPDRPASDCLALAEGAVRSLAQAGLIVVMGAGERETREPGVQLERTLLDLAAWAGEEGREGARMRRA